MGHWFHHQKVAKEYEEKISDLKGKLRNQPIGACALLLNQKQEVLLGKRKNGYKAGMYGLPGGRIEPSEPLEAAIRREVEEETGIKPEKLEYVGVVRETQSDYDFIHFIFVSHDIEQEPTLCEPEKCEGWEWVATHKLPDFVLPGHEAAIKMFLEKKSVIDLVD